MADDGGKEYTTHIPNKILEALAKAHLSPAQAQAVFIIARMTYGYNGRQMARISLQEFQDKSAGALLRNNAARALNDLAERKILVKVKGMDGQTTAYGFQEDVSLWVGSINFESTQNREHSELSAPNNECSQKRCKSSLKIETRGSLKIDTPTLITSLKKERNKKENGGPVDNSESVDNSSPPSGQIGSLLESGVPFSELPAPKGLFRGNDPEPLDPENLAFLDSEKTRLGNLLKAKIKTVTPERPDPSMREWNQDMKSLLVEDRIKPADVDAVIHWAFSDKFWRSVVDSPRVLRKNFFAIRARMLGERRGKDDGKKRAR